MPAATAARPKPTRPAPMDKAIRIAADLMKQAGDPTRLRVILMLADGEQHVGALQDQLSQSQPAVSHHLSLMRHSRVIESRRDGKRIYYSLTDTGRELARVAKGLVGG